MTMMIPMENSSTTAGAEEVPQILREIELLERTIGEMQKQKEAKQKQLEAKQKQLQRKRRQILLASIEHCTSPQTIELLWQKIEPAEQQDVEIVCKFISVLVGDESTSSVYGDNPWSEWQDHYFWRERHRTTRIARNCPVLPETLLSEPKILLAFVAARGRLNYPFYVPRSVNDNKDVMMAVCAKCASAFPQASSRLRDDEDLVRLALTDQDAQWSNIKHVSIRLLQDKDMVRHAVSMGCFKRELSCARHWLERAAEGMNVREQKEIARAILPPLLQREWIWHFLSQLSLKPLLDDAEFMLPFVQLHWKALKFCSTRLAGCDRNIVHLAVSQNINAWRYAKGNILEEYEHKRTVDYVLDEIKNGLFSKNIPNHLQSNRDIILASVVAGIALDRIAELVPLDKLFILKVIAANPEKVAQCGDFYCNLPMQLQTNVEIAEALLKAGFILRRRVLENVPSLLGSREAMMDAVAFPTSHYEYDEDEDSETFPAMVDQCDFRDDAEFMWKAYLSCFNAFVHASERLLSSRDFVSRILDDPGSGSLINHTTSDFLIENPDLALKAIDAGCYVYELDHRVWMHKEVAMGCLQRRSCSSVFNHIAQVDPNHPLFNDKDVIFLAVEKWPESLRRASLPLREDREFILSLVNGFDTVLQWAPSTMKYDKEILLAAMARSSSTISNCFGDCFEFNSDFEFLRKFASEIRLAIATHHSFMELLRGTLDPQCPLSMLNLDMETGIAWKKKIAESAGIHFPISLRLQLLTDALVNMEKFGF